MEEFREYLESVVKDRDSLTIEKARGKIYVPKHNRNRYIELTYILFLGNKVLKLMKRKVPVNDIIGGLRNQDWSWYSYAGKAYYGETLSDILFEKKSEISTVLLSRQTYFLSLAGNVIAEYLEG